MPGVEVLPTSTVIKTPGYALVPDTGPSPSGLQPAVGRKRAGRASGLTGGDTTVRQENATLKHLAELDKDNHRDVQVPVPKDSTTKASKKTTQNVRRILMSQKTFSNHLADEEAALSQRTSIGSVPQPSRLANPQNSRVTPQPRRLSTLGTQIAYEGSWKTDRSPYSGMALQNPTDPSESDPLLKSYVPSAPSAEVMKALLSAPALSYNAARAAPPPSGRPQRQFCELCGYWGNIKCIKCGARVCGLECKRVHDEDRCLKFYA